ncbi:hypothetical protein ACMZ4X_01684 [Achromobacter marplatensis]
MRLLLQCGAQMKDQTVKPSPAPEFILDDSETKVDSVILEYVQRNKS